jgi:hypothetical protein
MYDMYTWHRAGTPDQAAPDTPRSPRPPAAARAGSRSAHPAGQRPVRASQAVQTALDRRDNGGDASSMPEGLPPAPWPQQGRAR